LLRKTSINVVYNLYPFLINLVIQLDELEFLATVLDFMERGRVRRN